MSSQMQQSIERDFIAGMHEDECWGPLKLLVGKWVGAREQQIGTGEAAQFYEMRTFRRRSAVRESTTSQIVYPLLVSIQVFDFYHRDRQLSEETGYLLWKPEVQQVAYLAVQPAGISRLECTGSLEEGNTCCLMFNSDRKGFGTLDTGVDQFQSHLLSTQSILIYDSRTFRFDQTVVFQDFGQKKSVHREVGELLRVAP